MNRKSYFVICFSFIFLLVFSVSCKAGADITENVTITYISDQGKNVSEEKIVPAGYLLKNSDLSELSAEGYKFLGWYLKNEKAGPGQKVEKNSVLVAKWSRINDTKAPKNVSCLTAEPGDCNVYLTWTDPDDKDLLGVEISYISKTVSKSAMSMEPNSIFISAKTQYAVIPKLENGLSYVFTVKTVDFSGNKSKGETVSSVPSKKELEKVEKVVISNPEKDIDYGDTVVLSCNTPDAMIYYTTDGKSVPPENSILYTSGKSIKINYDDAVDIKAVAIKEGFKHSDITEKTYTIKKYNVTFDNKGLGNVPDTISNLKKGDIITEEQLACSAPCSGFEFSKWIDEKGNEIKAGHKITDSLLLTAVWNDIPPEPIKELKAVPDYGKVTLSWVNPEINDIEKIIVSVNGEYEIPVKGESETVEIDNLEIFREHSFSIKVIDKNSNESNICSIKLFPFKPYEFTEKPRMLKKEYNVFNFDTVEFGDWPQSLLKNNDSIKIKDKTVKVNQWDCYIDNIGNYYVKRDNGKYYKLEPIQWNIITNNYDGKKLLLSCRILDNCKYSERSLNKRQIDGVEVDDNNYKYSELRAYLNGYDYINPDNSVNNNYLNKGFLQKAFTEYAIENIICTTHIDNSYESSIFPDIYNHDKNKGYTKPDKVNSTIYDTKDKIFVLSKKDVYDIFLTRNYPDVKNDTVFFLDKISVNYKYDGYKYWWLRSTYCEPSSSAFYIDTLGVRDECVRNVSTDYFGILPLLTTQFEF